MFQTTAVLSGLPICFYTALTKHYDSFSPFENCASHLHHITFWWENAWGPWAVTTTNPGNWTQRLSHSQEFCLPGRQSRTIYPFITISKWSSLATEPSCRIPFPIC